MDTPDVGRPNEKAGLDASVVVVSAVDPPKPENDDTGALPNSGGALAASTGAGAVSGTLGSSGPAAGCVGSSALAGVLNENGDGVDSVGFGGGTPPNTEAAGAISASLTGGGGVGDPNIEVAWLVPVPTPKMELLLVPIGGTPNNDAELGLGASPKDNRLVSATLNAGFSIFSPSQRGFSASLVGVTCAGLNTLSCGGVADTGLFTAAEFAKKLGILELVGGGDTDAGLVNAAEFPKKLGMPDPAVSGGVADGGLLCDSTFAKKLGMPDPPTGPSAVVTFAGSGVAVVRVIDGACGPEGGGCADIEDGGLGGCSGSFVTGGGGEAVLVGGPSVALGLVKENGSEDMGGSFAVARPCWICGLSFAKLNPAGTSNTGTFLAASSKAT
jgi:hypothetical protein